MLNVELLFSQKGQKELKDTLNWVENRADSLNKTEINIKTNNKEVQELNNKMEYLGDVLSSLKTSYKQLGDTSSAVAQKVKSEMNMVSDTIENVIRLLGDNKKISKNALSNLISSGQGSFATQFKEAVDAANEVNTKIKEMQREVDKLNQKAKDAGGLAKSLLQDAGLNTRGAKDTRAQYEYQINALKETLNLIKQTEGATEQYNHARESMVYEVKHVTGKELYQEALDAVKQLTQLENKKAEAQKQGKTVMEDYYNTQIALQEKVLNNTLNTATDPTQLKEKLQANFQVIYDALADVPDIQADFAAQFEQTGMLTQGWSDGMKEFVLRAKEGIETQRQLNTAKIEQFNIEQKEKEYLKTLQQKFDIEKKISQLSTSKKNRDANANQIEEYKKQLGYLNQILVDLQKEYKIEDKISDKIDEVTKAHKQEQDAIAAKNRDLELSQGIVSDTFKNFMNFTIYYAFITKVRQGIQLAIETMKDLDKALTDIKLVTGGTAEETAKLAKEYNDLAKEMGSTTIEVANGAGEWFNESRDHLKTLELLETRED